MPRSLTVLAWRARVHTTSPLSPVPRSAFCRPVYDAILADLISKGYFWSTLDRGLAHSSALCASPLVDAVHMTGGVRTHDAIVWGAPAEIQSKNKRAGTPALQKPMTSELGCITPWIVCESFRPPSWAFSASHTCRQRTRPTTMA